MKKRSYDFSLTNTRPLQKGRLTTWVTFAIRSALSYAIRRNRIRRTREATAQEYCEPESDPHLGIRENLAADEERVSQIVKHLPQRSQFVLRGWSNGRTLKEMGKELGVSTERVRQIRDQAFERIRRECQCAA